MEEYLSHELKSAVLEYSAAYTVFDALVAQYNVLPWWAIGRRRKLGLPLAQAEAALNRALDALNKARG